MYDVLPLIYQKQITMITTISKLSPEQIIIFDSGAELHIQTITKKNGQYRVFGFIPSIGIHWEFTKPGNYQVITF